MLAGSIRGWHPGDRIVRTTGLLNGCEFREPEYWFLYKFTGNTTWRVLVRKRDDIIPSKFETAHWQSVAGRRGCCCCGKAFEKRDLFLVDPSHHRVYCLVCVDADI